MRVTKLYDWWSGGLQADAETPTQQPYLLTATERTETTETLSWTEPLILPTGYWILIHEGAAVDADPMDDTNYTSSTVFESGQEIGTGNYYAQVLAGVTSIQFTGLTTGTTYHYKIGSFNGSGSNKKYRTVPEKGHLWQTQPTISSPGIGAAQKADGSVCIKTEGENIYYSDDYGDTYNLWANIPGETFHSCEVCEGGTIHDSSGTPVSIKYIFNSHSGTGNIYAGYVPGDVPELIATGPTGETWNEGAWNSTTSQYCAIADSAGGGSRIVLMANARTAVFDTTLGTNSWASVCATPGAADGTRFIAVAKNPASSGFAAMKLVGSTWSIKASPVGKNYHMIQFCPGLGGVSSRVVVTSADGTGNDILITDDYFESYTEIAETGAYGANYFDPVNARVCAVSRTAGEVIKISSTGLVWEDVTNPDNSSVWFNVLAPFDRFIIQASSGTSLAAKTIPSNIQSATTRTLHYNTYRDNLPTPMSAGNAALMQEVVYGIDDISGLWDKLQCGWVADLQAAKDSVLIDLKNPSSTTFRLIEVNTVTFTAGVGVRSNGTTSYLRTGFIPATHNADQDSLSFAHKINTDVEATQFDYGCQGSGGTSQRICINTHATDDTVASVAMNSSIVASGANASSVGRWYNVRTGSTAADHDIYKNGAAFDGSNSTRNSQPNVEAYWGAFNNNGVASLFCTRDQGCLLIFTGLTAQEVADIDALLNYTPV